MSEQTDLRETVRARYAAAATAVPQGGGVERFRRASQQERGAWARRSRRKCYEDRLGQCLFPSARRPARDSDLRERQSQNKLSRTSHEAFGSVTFLS